MAVKYKTVARKNPQNPIAPAKHYAVAVNGGEVDLDKLTKLIGDGSTVREADIYAVLISLVNVAEQELADGKTIRLGKLGSLSLSLSSNGEDTAEQVTTNSIKKAKILYRSNKRLKKMLRNLEYQKVQ